ESGRRLRHARWRRATDLRRQGEEFAEPAAQLLSQERSAAQSRQDHRPGAEHHLGGGAERVREPASRTGTDSPVAATLERAGATAAPPLDVRMSGPGASAL